MQYRLAFRAGLCGLLAAAATVVVAQAAPAQIRSPEPTASSPSTGQLVNPAAPVPAVLYRSVFADTPTGVETEQADWKKANAEVGQFTRGHIDVLKWEAAHAEAPKDAPVKAGATEKAPAVKPQSTQP